MALRGIQEYIARAMTILHESKTSAIIVIASAIYSCIPLKAIKYYYIIIYIIRLMRT